MSTGTYILGVIAALIALFTVVELLRRGRLRERHAIWWLVAAILAVIIGVFPAALIWAVLVHVRTRWRGSCGQGEIVACE